jgi:hypothetical protein
MTAVQRAGASMERVVVLGRGAAGKSTFAARLGVATGLPVVELDAHFWLAGLVAISPERWGEIQQVLADGEEWIMEGDLGPYDMLDVRLQAADTVIVLDFGLLRCMWRALRRSRERSDFWWWLVCYRVRWRPRVLDAIDAHALDADVYVLRRPRDVERFIADAGSTR